MASNLMPSPSVDAYHQQGQSRSLVGAIGHRPGRSNWLTFDSLIILQKTLSGLYVRSVLFQNCLNFGGRSDDFTHPLEKVGTSGVTPFLIVLKFAMECETENSTNTVHVCEPSSPEDSKRSNSWQWHLVQLDLWPSQTINARIRVIC